MIGSCTFQHCVAFGKVVMLVEKGSCGSVGETQTVENKVLDVLVGRLTRQFLDGFASDANS